MSLRAFFWLCGLLLTLVGCGDGPGRAPSLGEAFVGPLSMNLRQEVSPNAPVAATARHGDRLEILGQRRRFIKVRTGQGIEGWTDSRQLLSTQQMQALRELAARSAKLPSQGKARVFAALNLHTEPNRQSPSFYQLSESQTVDVIGHRLAPRVTAAQAPALLTIAKKKPVVRKKKESSRIPPPPSPPAPKLPENWVELSRTRLPEPPPEEEDDEKTKGKQKRRRAPEPVRLEDWALVRTSDGKAGWALMSALVMAIPDEVAQYSEGHRITSYFSLGKAKGDEGGHHHWLWTTMVRGGQPMDFDGFRVFSYNVRRQRYETTYRERDVVGFYPTSLGKAEVFLTRNPVLMPTFTLVVREEGGSLVQRTYVYEGYRVRLAGTVPYDGPISGISSEPDGDDDAPAVPEPSTPSQPWYERWKEKASFWKRS